MNLIDTVGINHVFTEAIKLDEDYYLAPDISDEVEMAEMIHGKRVSEEIRTAVELDEFDESVYLHQYKLALNSYKKRSFYNMKGFGDVSIMDCLEYPEQSVNPLLNHSFVSLQHFQSPPHTPASSILW